MPNRYVVTAKSNIKGGVDCKLGPKTLIIGPRASGKSSIVNTIELALTGRVSDIAGREDVGLAADLMSLAPVDAGTLFSEVTLSDGSVASWQAKRTKSGSSKATHSIPAGINPETVFPIRSILSPLVGNPETVRKFLLSHAVGNVVDIDIETLIPKTLLSHYKNLQSNIPASLSSIDRLVAVLEAAQAKARGSAVAMRAAKRILESTGQGLPTKPTEDQLIAAKNTVVAARANVEKAVVAVTVEASRQMASSNTSSLKKEIETLKQENVSSKQLLDTKAVELKNVERTILQLPKPLQMASILEPVRAAMAVSVTLPDCPVCGLIPGMDVIANRLKSLDAAMSSIVQQRQERIRLDQLKNVITVVINQIQYDIDRADRRIKDCEIALASIGSIPSAAVEGFPMNIEELRKIAATVEESLRQLENSRSAWAATANARESQVTAEREASDWKLVADACSDAVKQLLDDNVDRFIEKVQSRLPSNRRFSLQLRTGEREAIRIGYLVDGVIRTALSGGEWLEITSAVADVCASENDLSIVVPEDRGIDPISLSSVLDGLGKCHSQVIITSTVAPDRIDPSIWTVIQRPG